MKALTLQMSITVQTPEVLFLPPPLQASSVAVLLPSFPGRGIPSNVIKRKK